MKLLNLINAKLELLRLEAKYTKRRHRRSAFVSDAVYVDGEYIYGNSNISSTSASSSGSSPSPPPPKRDVLPVVRFSSIEEEDDTDDAERDVRDRDEYTRRDRDGRRDRDLERDTADEEWDSKMKRLREREGYGYRWRVEGGGPDVLYEERDNAGAGTEGHGHQQLNRRWSSIGRGFGGGKKDKRRSVAVMYGGVGDWEEYKDQGRDRDERMEGYRYNGSGYGNDEGVSRAWEEDRM